MVHVRYDGRSFDFSEAELRLHLAATDAEVRAAVARRLDVGLDRLNPYVVDRSSTGHLVVRPEAVYG